MTYIEYLEKSNQSADRYNKIARERPDKLEDTPEAREHCIKELKALLTMLIDAKNLLIHKYIPLRDTKYLSLVQWGKLSKIQENIVALEEDIKHRDFDTFLDALRKISIDSSEVYRRLVKISKRSEEPFNKTRDLDKEGILS